MVSYRVLGFAAFLGVGLATDTDLGYNLLVKEAGADVPRTCFKVNDIPGSPRGAFFIGGPAKYEIGGYRFRSFFDGYGRINRFEFRKGEVCFTAKFMNTSFLQHAEKLGRICNGLTFLGTEPPLPYCPITDPICFLTGAMVDNNWVNLMPVAGQGLLLTDSPVFVQFDYETMGVHGGYPWTDGTPGSGGMVPKWLIEHGKAPASGSAHPVLRAKTEATFIAVMTDIGVPFLEKSGAAIYTIDGKSMERTWLHQVPMNGVAYFHSFGVSENYVVLPTGLKTGLPTSENEMITAFKDGWEGIHVVGIDDGKIQIFDTEKFYHVHIANTFENATGIVIDLGTFQAIPFSAHMLATANFTNKTERDRRDVGSQNVERIHMHLAGPLKGKVTREKVSPPGRLTDFFTINKKHTGLPYCFYYAVEWFHDDKSYASMAILKHDLCTGKRKYWAKLHAYPCEPTFISTGAGEDDGLLVFTILNGTRGKNDFVVLNAKTFEEITIIQLPVHIPFLAHGQFIPKDAQEAVKSAMALEDPKFAAAIDSTFVV